MGRNTGWIWEEKGDVNMIKMHGTKILKELIKILSYNNIVHKLLA